MRVRRRRAWRVPLAVVAALALGVIVFSLANASLETNDSLSSVFAGGIALVGVFVAAMKWLGEGVKPIDHDQEAYLLAGALLRRWKPELEHRAGRGDGRTIPLRWQRREDSVAAPPSAVMGMASDLRVTLNLDGELSGNLDQAAAKLATEFDGVPNHRLVVLGEPGSGKTFLALVLTVGLLRSRQAGQRVPVLLSLASWDPVAQSLDTWMERSIAEENYAGNTDIPTALLAAGLVLPVLDGLDELPDHVRRRAVSRINDTLRGPRPIVLTCRSADYAEVLAAGAPVLLRAPVVQVQPLSTKDVADHLRTTDNRPDSWSAVIDHVETNENSPLTTALSTPLMLSLFTAGFRTVDPTPLLSDPELDNRLAIEDRLIDVLADSMDATESRQWLTYLAEEMHSHGTRNLSWWQLGMWTPPLGQLFVALFGGLALTIVAALSAPALPTIGPPSDFWDAVLRRPWIFGVIGGTALLTAAMGARDAVPAAREPGLARRRFMEMLAAGNVAVLFVGVALATLAWLVLDAGAESTTVSATVVGVATGLGLVIGLGVGLHGYWTARGHRLAVTTPHDLLRHERTPSLVAAVVVALVVGAGTVLVASWGGTVGGHLGQQLAQWRGQPVILDRGFPDAPTHLPWVVDRAHLPVQIWFSVLIGLVAGGCTLLARPWTQFGLARMTLAVGRQLPLRLMAFLDQAHKDGLLRVTGGRYQFWHIRMQERLVTTAIPDPPPSKLRKAWPAITAGLVALAAITVLVAIGNAQPPSCPDTGVAELDQNTSRVAAGHTSACLGLVANPSALDLPTSELHSDDNYRPDYLVVGEFDRMTPQQRAALPLKPPSPVYGIRYIELVDPIPSVSVVPELARQLMATTETGYRWDKEDGPFYGMTVLLENGQVQVVNW